MDGVKTNQKFPARRGQDKGLGPAVNGVRLSGDITAIDQLIDPLDQIGLQDTQRRSDIGQAAGAVGFQQRQNGIEVWRQIHLGKALHKAALTLPALAQDNTGVLEEIIVTAQKRRESIQDVPVAVSALTGESLAENNVRTLEDLSASVPGFTIAANVNYGSAPMSIRGVGGANGGGNVFADEPVATYVNDAFVGRLRMSTADLVDIGSVEVLRGPQDACAAVSRVRSSRPRPPCWRRSGSA